MRMQISKNLVVPTCSDIGVQVHKRHHTPEECQTAGNTRYEMTADLCETSCTLFSDEKSAGFYHCFKIVPFKISRIFHANLWSINYTYCPLALFAYSWSVVQLLNSKLWHKNIFKVNFVHRCCVTFVQFSLERRF